MDAFAGPTCSTCRHRDNFIFFSFKRILFYFIFLRVCVFWRMHLRSLQKLWLRLRDLPLVSDPELLKSLWTRDLWVQPELKIFQNVRMFSLKQHILKKKEKKLPRPSRWPWKSASRFPSNSLKMLKHRIRQQKYSQKFPPSVMNMFQKVQKKKKETGKTRKQLPRSEKGIEPLLLLVLLPLLLVCFYPWNHFT